MKPSRAKALKQILNEALDGFVTSGEIKADAIEPALTYTDWHDKEVAAFICAVLAYGRVEHIKKSIHKILDPMGANPHRWILENDEQAYRKLTKSWSHRFNTHLDMILLLKILKHVYSEHGSLEKFFNRKPADSAFDLLENFVIGIEEVLQSEIGKTVRTDESFWFFFPRPSKGSACKRLNLFLRWMVGKGPLDLSLWTAFQPSLLVIPLDVHVLRQARSLQLTRRKQADWVAAEEVTKALRHLDPDDPVQFDFALCHLGMRGKILSSKSIKVRK